MILTNTCFKLKPLKIQDSASKTPKLMEPLLDVKEPAQRSEVTTLAFSTQCVQGIKVELGTINQLKKNVDIFLLMLLKINEPNKQNLLIPMNGRAFL